MPNWCSNYVVFEGTEHNITNLKTAIDSAIVRESETKQAQLIVGSEVKEGYFFELYIQDSTATTLVLTYETRWAPNQGDVADVCKQFELTAEHEYDESGLQVHGKTIYSADGTYIDDAIPNEFLALIDYNDDEDVYIYIPTGMQSTCKDDLIDEYYELWKANK